MRVFFFNHYFSNWWLKFSVKVQGCMLDMVWSHLVLTEKYLGEQKLLNFNSCSRHLKIVVINKLRATFVNTRNSWNLSSSWFLVRNTFERNDKFEIFDIWIVLKCKNPFFFNHSKKYFLKSQLFPFYFHDNRHNSILLWLRYSHIQNIINL